MIPEKEVIALLIYLIVTGRAGNFIIIHYLLVITYSMEILIEFSILNLELNSKAILVGIVKLLDYKFQYLNTIW